jgi:hypothetical protein
MFLYFFMKVKKEREASAERHRRYEDAADANHGVPGLDELVGALPLPLAVTDRVSNSRFGRRKKPIKPSKARALLNAGFILLMLGVIAFSIYQVASHVTVGLNTLRTQEILDESYVTLELYVFRDEQPLMAEGSDTYRYAVPNGGRVGVGQPLGTAYALGDAVASAELQQKLNAYGRQIDLLRSLGGLGTPADARDAAESVDVAYLNLLKALERGDLSAADGYASGMQDGLGRYDVLTGAAGSQSAAALEQACNALVADYTPLMNMSTDRSGYFYYTCDGYENLFTMEAAQTMTPEDFFALTEQTAAAIPAGIVGKMVYDPTWYAAAYVSLADDALEVFQQGYNQGATYTLRVTDGADAEVDMTIVRLVPDANGALLVFRSQDMPAGFDFPRSFTAETVSLQVSGYRIPSEAIVTLRSHKTGQDVTGVYILSGNVVEFRKINIRVARDGYVIANTYEDMKSYQDSLSEEARAELTADGWVYLGLNDNIITGGNEIHEGKVIG